MASKLSRSGKSAAHTLSPSHLPLYILQAAIGPQSASPSITYDFHYHHTVVSLISNTSCTAGHSNELYHCSVFFSGDWTLFRIDARSLSRASGFFFYSDYPIRNIAFLSCQTITFIARQSCRSTSSLLPSAMPV